MKAFIQFLEEEKASKEEAEYQAHPHEGRKCSACTMWRAPNKCTAVAGDIDPNGWCQWYRKSHRRVG
jgi:High potential iron-sulfur protein